MYLMFNKYQNLNFDQNFKNYFEATRRNNSGISITIKLISEQQSLLTIMKLEWKFRNMHWFYLIRRHAKNNYKNTYQRAPCKLAHLQEIKQIITYILSITNLSNHRSPTHQKLTRLQIHHSDFSFSFQWINTPRLKLYGNEYRINQPLIGKLKKFFIHWTTNLIPINRGRETNSISIKIKKHMTFKIRFIHLTKKFSSMNHKHKHPSQVSI